MGSGGMKRDRLIALLQYIDRIIDAKVFQNEPQNKWNDQIAIFHCLALA